MSEKRKPLNSDLADALGCIIDNDELIEVGRKAIEDWLIEARDRRISMLGCNNGLVVRERDGRWSDIIRCDTPGAILIAMRAIRTYLQK